MQFCSLGTKKRRKGHAEVEPVELFSLSSLPIPPQEAAREGREEDDRKGKDLYENSLVTF